MSTSIESVIQQIIASELDLDPAAISPDADIRSLPDIESIKILRAVLRLESRYGVELEDEAVFEVRSVTELAHLIRLKLSSVATEASEGA